MKNRRTVKTRRKGTLDKSYTGDFRLFVTLSVTGSVCRHIHRCIVSCTLFTVVDLKPTSTNHLIPMRKKFKHPRYSEELHLEYLLTMQVLGKHWLAVFQTPPEDKTFWDASYWDLFTNLFKSENGVKKTDAISYIQGKTAPTAAKYINTAIKRGLIIEEDNKARANSKIVKLSDEMKNNLEIYFNNALVEVETLGKRIKEKGTIN